jgi:hypothetical protein
MAKRKTPAQQRVELSRVRRLGLGSALAEMQEKFRSPESRDGFGIWRRDPMTMLLIDAIRELSATPPPGYIDTADIGPQYGVSSGLSLAAAVLDDPSTLFPHLFTGAAPGSGELPPSDYGTDPMLAPDAAP